jgi:hypothetical protein
MYFGDLLTLPERDLFQKTYKTQHDEILTRVDPVDESGAGVLQLRNWLFRRGTLGMDPKEKGAETSKKFYRHVTKDWNTNEVPVPIFSAEAWIAQENVWIQREIFRLIKGVNDDISVFRPIVEWPVDKNAKTFDQDLARGEKKNFAYRFQNVNFEVSLTLEANDTLKFKISNLLPRKQKLDLRFRILMNEQLKDARYDRSKSDLEQSVFRISGEALTPKGEAGSVIESEIPFTKEKELDRRGIYGIEQILTWETAAIKRLDNVSIGSNDVGDFSSSHREYVTPLRSLEGEPKEASGGGGNAGNKTKLQHDLWTDRYLDVTEQSRRIPVAVAMIVDQDHVNRVLTHFNNSKYRYFHSQVLLNHYSGSLLPTIKADPQREGAAPPAAGGPMGMPMGGGGAGAGGGQEHETNMELIIYGVMTLYQRYPPRPAPEKKQ